MVAPITILHTTVRKDIPFAMIASITLLMMCLDSHISRLDAVILFAMFIIFMVFTVRGSKEDTPAHRQPLRPRWPRRWAWARVWHWWCWPGHSHSGLQAFVDNASAIARSLGVSEAVIGLTIVACGTSLPELATSVVAARRGNSGIAIGNVLGSNVFNILMILGLTGLVSPMAMQGITQTDLSVMVVSMILLWLFSYTRYRIERWEGGALALAFVAYLVWLLMPYLG
jgi:cation:H+ antiporter